VGPVVSKLFSWVNVTFSVTTEGFSFPLNVDIAISVPLIGIPSTPVVNPLLESE